MLTLKTRSTEKEMIDLQPLSDEEALKAFRLIRYINRHLGGANVILSHLKHFSRAWNPDSPIRILDVGAGACDIPQTIVDWARKAGWRVEITALDSNPKVLEYAKSELACYPEIQLLHADIFQVFFPAGSFDYVISSLTFHHLDDKEIPQALRLFDRLARRGMIINDLVRSETAYFWIYLLSRLTPNKVFRNDAPLSVRRSFKRGEVENWIRETGFSYLKYYNHFAYRFALAGEKIGTPSKSAGFKAAPLSVTL
jgi:ubiquinone/menaquinone biosynthesis C-methylase UbiE